MIKKQLIAGAATVFILAALSSCSSSKTKNSDEVVLFKAITDFNPKGSFEFENFDTSRDGQVNFKEWKKGLLSMLKKYDVDGDGSFERKEGEKADFDWMLDANKNEDDVISPSEVDDGLKATFKNASGTNSLISIREFRTFNWMTGVPFGKRNK